MKLEEVACAPAGHRGPDVCLLCWNLEHGNIQKHFRSPWGWKTQEEPGIGKPLGLHRSKKQSLTLTAWGTSDRFPSRGGSQVPHCLMRIPSAGLRLGEGTMAGLGGWHRGGYLG